MEDYENNGMEHQDGDQRGPPFKRPRGDGMQNGRGMEYYLERGDEKLAPNHILLITVINPKFPINVEVIYKVCSIVGKVKKIVCFERQNVTQAMVEFETLEAASKARTSLHGCDIYTNCCTMKVEYSKLDNLKVRENCPMSWDFTEGDESEAKRPVILNAPDMGGYGAGFGGGMGGAMGGGMSGAMGGGMSGAMGGGMSGAMGGGGMSGAMGGGNNMGSGNNMGGMQNKMSNNMGMGEMNMGQGPAAGGGYGGYGMGGMDERSCVMLVYGLEPPKWSCDRLFNLICQYGNVNKIFFMKNKPNTAMVEMGGPEGVEAVMRYISELQAFGEKIRFDVSKKHKRLSNVPSDFSMSDGSSSVKEFFSERMNRFINPDMARKNRLIHPSKVLHFFNLTKTTEGDIEEMFSRVGAPIPKQIKYVPAKADAKLQGVGLCYFESVSEATEALVLANHEVIEKRNIKLCYSPAKY